MGQKNLKGTVSITKADGKIRLRWRFQSVRYSLNLPPYNKSNLIEAKKMVLQIEQDMMKQQFDFSLKKYKQKQFEGPKYNALGLELLQEE